MRRTWVQTVVGVMILTVGLSGCYGVRKKFIRKKKASEEPPVYVNLKEYSNVPVEQVYRDYHVFLRGWLDDLVLSLQDNGSWKRSKKAIDEALRNFSQMRFFFNDEGTQATNEMFDTLLAVKEYVYIPSHDTSDNDHARWIDKIKRLQRKVEKMLPYDNVKPWLKNN